MVTNTTAATELVEMGEQRDRLGRKITPRERRAELVSAWRESGLTQAEFARREGVGYSSFASWVQAARRLPVAGAAANPARPGVRFVEAQVAAVNPAPALPSAFALCVRLPDGTELRGQQASELAELLRALRR
jgi:transposase-like protein